MSANVLSLVHISKGSGKMLDIPSINTSSLTNPFCIAKSKQDIVCNKCYSNRLTKLRPSLERKLLANGALLSSRELLPEELPKLNARYARFSSFGEIINVQHYLNLCAIAKHNPYTTFGLWTKRYNIIKKYPKVENIKYIFSVEKVDNDKPLPAEILEFFDKTFSVVSKGEPANCFGSCIDCLVCYTDNEITSIREHIK